MRPSRAVVSSTSDRSCSFDDRLAAIAVARPAPWARSISAQAASQASSLRDDTTTRAPASAMRSAMARPMPRDEPVITATLPARENRVMASPGAACPGAGRGCGRRGRLLLVCALPAGGGQPSGGSRTARRTYQIF